MSALHCRLIHLKSISCLCTDTQAPFSKGQQLAALIIIILYIFNMDQTLLEWPGAIESLLTYVCSLSIKKGRNFIVARVTRKSRD